MRRDLPVDLGDQWRGHAIGKFVQRRSDDLQLLLGQFEFHGSVLLGCGYSRAKCHAAPCLAVINGKAWLPGIAIGAVGDGAVANSRERVQAVYRAAFQAYRKVSGDGCRVDPGDLGTAAAEGISPVRVELPSPSRGRGRLERQEPAAGVPAHRFRMGAWAVKSYYQSILFVFSILIMVRIETFSILLVAVNKIV